MKRKIPIYVKILGAIFIIIISFLIYGLSVKKKIYNSIFRLTPAEVRSILEKNPTQCTKLVECKLMPGDILFRRYITKTNQQFDELLNPYFTHSAMYIGNGEVFEALGDQETPPNQILTRKLNESNWVNSDLNNFVIIRLKNVDKIDLIIKRLKEIADDPEYLFGLPNDKEKRATCADVIVNTLEKEGIFVDLFDRPEIITPDYLFLLTERNGVDFEIIDYNITP